MRADNNTLIDELLALTDRCTEAAEKFKSLSESQLNYRQEPKKWSVLECLEHLNRYGDFYLPAIEKAIVGQQGAVDGPFKSGVIGNWFAGLMKVNNGRITKMQTPADKNPLGSALNAGTIDRFLQQQAKLRSLLQQARHTDLTRVKVPISLTRLVKLRLGDTFRFFVNHIERHIIQAQKVNAAGV